MAVGETPALMTVVGGVVVVAAVLLQTTEKTARPQPEASERTAATISAGPGSVAASRSFWYGIGCEAAPTRMTGASRSQKQCSAACAAISEPKPQN